jgi:hypothetical protein
MDRINANLPPPTPARTEGRVSSPPSRTSIRDTTECTPARHPDGSSPWERRTQRDTRRALSLSGLPVSPALAAATHSHMSTVIPPIVVHVTWRGATFDVQVTPGTRLSGVLQLLSPELLSPPSNVRVVLRNPDTRNIMLSQPLRSGR